MNRIPKVRLPAEGSPGGRQIESDPDDTEPAPAVQTRPGRLRLGIVTAISALALPSLALSVSLTNQAPSDFTARFEVLRNGKPMAETTVEFSTDNGTWLMRSESAGTHGLARFIGLRESSESRGVWAGEGPRPMHFEREVRAVRKMQWSAEFNWDSGRVRSVHPDGDATLNLEPGTLDENSVGIAVRSGLRKGQSEWFLPVLDDDEIEQEHYKVLATEDIETSLGCMTAQKVEKIRSAGSKRYTRTYYAENFGFVPVFMQHGKTGDDHLESRLISLTIDGVEVQAGPACS